MWPVSWRLLILSREGVQRIWRRQTFDAEHIYSFTQLICKCSFDIKKLFVFVEPIHTLCTLVKECVVDQQLRDQSKTFVLLTQPLYVLSPNCLHGKRDCKQNVNFGKSCV